MEDNSLIFGLETCSRSLCAVTADTEKVRFLATSQAPTGNHSINLLNYDDDDNQIQRQMFKTKNENWKISSCPQDAKRFVTVSNEITKSEKGYKQTWAANIFDVQVDLDELHDGQQIDLEPVQSIAQDNLLNAIWRPDESSNPALLLISSGTVSVMEGSDGEVRPIAKTRGLNGIGAWDAHHSARVITAVSGHNLKAWDIRENNLVWELNETNNIRDIDFNPNKQNQIALGCEDGGVKFYDTRNLRKPIKKLVDIHTHWAWSVKYNPIHDQLFLTAGGDGRVFLHSITSVSSEPFGSLIEEEQDKTTLEDGVILKLEEHDDAVYGCEWSQANPWLFASLSHDGRIVINQVPKSVKYDILL